MILSVLQHVNEDRARSPPPPHPPPLLFRPLPLGSAPPPGGQGLPEEPPQLLSIALNDGLRRTGWLLSLAWPSGPMVKAEIFTALWAEGDEGSQAHTEQGPPPADRVSVGLQGSVPRPPSGWGPWGDRGRAAPPSGRGTYTEAHFLKGLLPGDAGALALPSRVWLQGMRRGRSEGERRERRDWRLWRLFR